MICVKHYEQVARVVSNNGKIHPPHAWQYRRLRVMYSMIHNFVKNSYKPKKRVKNASTIACHISKKLTNITEYVVKRIFSYSDL